MGSACNSCNKVKLTAKPILSPNSANNNITSTWIYSPLSKTIQRDNQTQRTSLPPLKTSNSRRTFLMDQDPKDYIAVIKNLNAKKDNGALLEFCRPSLNSSNGLQGISYQDNSSSLPYTSSIKKLSYYSAKHNFHKYYTSIAEDRQSQEKNYSRGYTTYQDNKFLENRVDVRSTERTCERTSFLETLRINNELSKRMGEGRFKSPNIVSSGVITISYAPKRNPNKESNDRLELAIVKKKPVQEEKSHRTIRKATRSYMIDSNYKTPVHKNVLKKITLRSRKDSCSSKRKYLNDVTNSELSGLDLISKEEQNYTSRARTSRVYDAGKASTTMLFDDPNYLFARYRTAANDMSMISNNSTIIENTMAMTKVDNNGNKYINQYRIERKLGK
jgi:hypothetical protein